MSGFTVHPERKRNKLRSFRLQNLADIDYTVVEGDFISLKPPISAMLLLFYSYPPSSSFRCLHINIRRNEVAQSPLISLYNGHMMHDCKTSLKDKPLETMNVSTSLMIIQPKLRIYPSVPWDLFSFPAACLNTNAVFARTWSAPWYTVKSKPLWHRLCNSWAFKGTPD